MTNLVKDNALLSLQWYLSDLFWVMWDFGMRWSCVALSFLMTVGGVTSARAENILSALAGAYRHNSELNAQRANTRAADEQMARAKSGYRPSITGDADFGFSRTVVNQGGAVVTNPYGYGITINQRIFDGFQTLNNIAIAEASIRGSREQ